MDKIQQEYEKQLQEAKNFEMESIESLREQLAKSHQEHDNDISALESQLADKSNEINQLRQANHDMEDEMNELLSFREQELASKSDLMKKQSILEMELKCKINETKNMHERSKQREQQLISQLSELKKSFDLIQTQLQQADMRDKIRIEEASTSQRIV